LQRWIMRQILKTWDRQIAFLDTDLIKNKTILEIGCGNPRMLFLFNELGAKRSIGCDLSSRFVEIGLSRPYTYVFKSKLKVQKERIEVTICDFYDLNKTNIKVDTICCFQSLHHFSLKKFIETCSNLLNKHGHVVISDPVGNHPLRKIADFVGRYSRLLSPDEQAYHLPTVRNMFEERGFEVLHFRALNPFLEIYFHFIWLLKFLPDSWKHLLRAPMGLLRPLDNFLEATLLKWAPSLGWRYYYVFQKKDI